MCYVLDMRFTRNNVERAVRSVRYTKGLGEKLGVPRRKRDKIGKKFWGNGRQEVMELLKFFMDHDPLASWRRVIIALETMGAYGGKEAAEHIRHLAEPVTGKVYVFVLA